MKHVSHGVPVDLDKCEIKVYSQFGEDGVILEIIGRIFKKDYKDKVFFEFGVEDGEECNCHFLASILGWSGTFIESDKKYFEILNNKYKLNNKISTLNKMVTTENVQGLIDKYSPNINLLSIDIDSHDYWVWESISSTPEVVVIEYNADIDGNKVLRKDYNHPWDFTNGYGASINALIKLGNVKGYSLVHTTSQGVNAFFVRNDYIHLFPESKNPKIIKKNIGNFPEAEEGRFIEV